MNYNNRRTYSRKYQALQKAMEVKYSGVVYRALKKTVSGFISHLKTYGIESTRHRVLNYVFNEHIGPAIRRLYLDAGLMRAKEVRAEMRLIERKVTLKGASVITSEALYRFPLSEYEDNKLFEKRASFGTNDELTHEIIDYLQRFLLEKSVNPISQTTREWILRIISNGVQEGLGADEIAKEIEGSEFLRFQALRIVRTETVRATNIGAMKAAEASPFEVQKEWIAAHDNRVRHSHRFIDGQVVDYGQVFTNGLLQPGDPTGPASETINCRCTVAFVPKRENGRLVRKQPIVASMIPTQRPGIFSRIASFLRTG